MEKKLFKELYPVFTTTLLKNRTSYKDIDEIFAFIKEEILIHPVATYIGEFDHYTHTYSLKEHSIDPSLKNAKNILFCFGKELLVPEVLAVRPRSIGVAEMENEFVISFMQAPNPAANESMQKWVKALSL
jgi:hypothetical protein